MEVVFANQTAQAVILQSLQHVRMMGVATPVLLILFVSRAVAVRLQHQLVRLVVMDVVEPAKDKAVAILMLTVLLVQLRMKKNGLRARRFVVNKSMPTLLEAVRWQLKMIQRLESVRSLDQEPVREIQLQLLRTLQMEQSVEMEKHVMPVNV